MKRKPLFWAVFGGIVSVLLAGGIFIYLNAQNAPEPPKIVLEEAGNGSSNRDDVVEEQSESDISKRTGFERALETLEKPNDSIGGEDLATVKQALTRLMTAISDTEEASIIPKREDSSLLSNTNDLKTLKGYFLDGYTYSEDNVSVYLSAYDNVLQFIFILKSPEEKDVAVTGNYQKEVEQIQIGVFKR